jgi:hypothetical protein
MTKNEKNAVSCFYESISREDFAIHLYGRQNHRDPFAEKFSWIPMLPRQCPAHLGGNGG